MTRRSFLGSLAFAMTPLAARPALRRKDCFFGLHFDLHPNDRDKDLGRHLTLERAGELLNRTRPDYVQYDCKGHAGYLGFVSKVGTSSPGIVNDSLAIWRKATEDRGIGLFVHFSGVWDSLAVKQRPEWARVKPDGSRDDRQTSTFGPYVDELMLPQLLEAAGKYNLDGAWVDGECWATNPDYSPAAAAAFGKPLPKSPSEPHWQEFLEFNRERFRAYIKHYVDAMHAKFPEFQVASNWLYTTYVPEKPTLPVDFVSGDYLGNASIATARVEGRYLSAAGVPWDLMAWGFQRAQNNPIGHVHKPAVQLQQEASVVLAQGGGFQVYYQPTRAGYFDDRLIGVMEQLASFCRERQQLCHKSETVPQIGVLFSGHSLYRTSNKLFGGWPGDLTAPVKGWVAALVESHLPVDVIPDWKLETLADYPLVVVPEWPDIGDRAADALRAYKGKILFCGAHNARRFANELGIKVGEAKEQPAYLPSKDLFANAKGLWVDVEARNAWEMRHPTFDFTRNGACAASGTERIGAIYGPLGTVFNATHAPAARDFIERVTRRFIQPMVEVDAPACVEVVLRRKSGKLYAHVLNIGGMQVAGDYAAFDQVTPVGPVKLRMGSRERVLERLKLYEIVALDS